MNNLSSRRASDSDIQQIIDSKEKGTTMFMPVDVYYLIAKELKALREAGKEPVAWTDKEELRDAGNGGGGYLFSLSGNANKFSDPRRKIMLYAAPQLPADSIDYKALVLQLAEIAHGGPVDIGLLPVTVRSMQQRGASPQLPAVPDGAEQRLSAAVDLIKQAAPHMLADESLKDPDGVLCGKVHAVDSIQRYTAANTQFGGISLRQDGDGDYVLFADVRSMIAAAPKPEQPATSGFSVTNGITRNGLLFTEGVASGKCKKCGGVTKPEPAVKK